MGKGVAGRETSLNLCQPTTLLQVETSENLETLCCNINCTKTAFPNNVLPCL